MNDINKKYYNFISSINSLKNLKQDSSPTRQNGRKLDDFNKTINSLFQLKKKVYHVRREKLRKLVKRKRNKIRISSFTLMEHDFVENTHSNILEYIFDYNLLGEAGANILSDFVKGVDHKNSDLISNLILKKRYKVEREHVFEKGRMDLFIYDRINRFVIVIENKIFASVSQKDEEPEYNQLKGKTQLNNYINFIKKKYRSYRVLYLLLSFRDLEPDKYLPFIYLDYNYLYKVIDKYKLANNIINEYKLLLYTINNGLDHSIKLLNKKIGELSRNQGISLDLNSFEQMKVLINGIK